MTLLGNIPDATPINDLSGLIPTHLISRQELNEWEAANIIKAVQKYLGTPKQLEINPIWIKKVHKEMFDDTWAWAGEFRKSNYNLGVNWPDIPAQIKLLTDDLTHWRKEDNNISILEQSVRLHHRLVKIHPFINGNGRHARLVADIFLFNHHHPLPTWPDNKLIEESNIRNIYINALKEADKGDYAALLSFTRGLLS